MRRRRISLLSHPDTSSLFSPHRESQLFHPGEHIPGVDELAFFDVQALNCAALWRTNLILHLHRFHNEQTLAGFHLVSRFDEDANDFARHGSGNLLAALRLECAVPAAAPRTRVGNLHSKLLQAGLDLQYTISRWGEANLVRLPLEEKR